MKKWIGLFVILTSVFSISCDDDTSDGLSGEEGQLLHEGHEYVDLGLPSGALWATEDVSVNGSVFFSWGETVPKESYTVATYKYCAGADSTLTKYNSEASCGNNGFIDGLTELQPEDDAARVNWGGNWCTPTWDEWQELYDNCNWETITAEDGTTVFVATSNINGVQLFFPAAGAMQGTNMLYAGKGAYYWASSVIGDNCMYSDGVSLSPSSINWKEGKRPMGHCVRAVIPGDRQSMKYVDLGLPSGIKWAKTNIGAAKPEQTGLLFAWGETAPKAFYDFTNYVHCSGTPKSMTKYCTNAEFGTPDDKTRLDAEDDAAVQLLGEGWRMPTLEEIDELMKQCTWTAGTIGEQKIYTVTGPNGNSIIIPLAGTMWQTAKEYQNMRGFYWSSDLDDAGDMYAEGLFLNPVSFSLGSGFTRGSGRTIRAVHE